MLKLLFLLFFYSAVRLFCKKQTAGPTVIKFGAGRKFYHISTATESLSHSFSMHMHHIFLLINPVTEPVYCGKLTHCPPLNCSVRQ